VLLCCGFLSAVVGSDSKGIVESDKPEGHSLKGVRVNGEATMRRVDGANEDSLVSDYRSVQALGFPSVQASEALCELVW
jgi:hypothetical protein